MALSKIKTNSLLDDAVTAAKIATGTIVAADLAANSVDSSELVDGSIDASHIASSAVTNVKTNFQPGTTFKGDGSSTDGKITLNCSQNTHGVSIQSPAHASAATYTLTLPTSNGNANEFLQTNGSGVLTFATAISAIANDSIDSQHYAAASVDLEHMSVNSIDSDQYVDGSIDLAHMSVNSIDSDQYVDGSIDLAHMSANSIDSDQYVDGSIDTAHIADNQVTLAKMAGLARGKIIYGDASGDPAALTVGSNGQALVSDGTDISWGSAGGDADNYFASSGLSSKDLGTGLHIKVADSGADVDSGGGQLIIENNDNAGLSILTNTAGTGMINFGDSGDNNIGRILYDHGNNYMELVTNGSGQARFLSNGDMNVRVGDIFFETAGKGIVLGATSNVAANTLDDYEEGTWTPSLNYAGTTTGVTHEVQNGYYTKIGNRVTVRFSCRVDAKGSGNGHARFSGLPFTGVNAGWDEHAVNLFYDNTSDCWDLVGLLGTTHISLYYHADAGTGMDPAYKAQWTDDFQVFGEGTYSTAS